MSEQTVERAADAAEAGEQTSVEATTEQAEAESEKVEEVDWKAKFEAQQKVNRDLEQKVKGEAGTLRAQIEELQAKLNGTEAEYEQTKKQRETEQAALSKANEKILKAEVRAAAAGKITPDMLDALPGLLDLSSFEVGDDGEVDAEAINSAITDLVQQRPSLAVQDGKRFQGDADAGARKEARPAQLSKADVERLYAEGKHGEIVKAKAEGRLADYLAS